MPEETAKPGVPTAEVIAEKADQEAPIADPGLGPGKALGTLRNVDQTILRLNKLLASPGGLSAFLSTFNYTLYLLAYAQTKSGPITPYIHKLLALIKPTAVAVSKAPTSTLVDTAAIPSITALALLISKARMTLRLFGLLPLYAWLRTLLSGRKPGTDPVLHRISVLQASSYVAYQALENVSFLADAGALSPSVISFINRGDSTTARVYLWAYRAWLGGVGCDFLRLGREWQLESRRRTTRARLQSEGKSVAEYQDGEDQKFDAKWWTDATIASAWLPMALHYSSSTGGLPGWNLGWMGLCGLVAGSTRVQALWVGTT